MGSETAYRITNGYRPEIDGLRSVAVVSVILYHLGVGVFTGGYVGVDIFFVISGYLISGILWSELNSGSFTFLGFYERRARRIFPALFVVLLASMSAAMVIASPGPLRDFGQSLAATISFLSNIYFVAKSGYFNADAERTPLLHMWSLSVEEQFYIVFPIILLLVHRYAKPRLNMVLASLLAASLAYSLYLQQTSQVINFFYPHTRAWELVLGALIAANRAPYLGLLASQRALCTAIEATGAALVVVPIFAYTSLTPFPGLWAIPPVLGSGLVIFVAHERSLVGRILATKPMVGIGLISYSAYLWHQPLFAFVRIATVGALSTPLLIFLVIITFCLAYLSWRYIERPFRDRRRFSRAQIFGLAAGSLLPLFVVGMAMHLTHGFPQRYSAQTRALGASSVASPMTAACHTDGFKYRPPTKACRYFGKTVDWAVLGDSHGLQPAYALAEELAKSDHGLLHLTFSACEPALLFESSNPGCSAWMRESTAFLVSHPDIKNVVLAFRYSRSLAGDQLHTYPELPNEHPNFMHNAPADVARDAYAESFTTLVQQLVRSGKTVFITAPIPELPTHVDHYIYGSVAFGLPERVQTGASIAYYNARNSYILGVINRLAGLPNVKIIDPRLAVCDPTRCFSIHDGQAFYVDDNHLSMAGARRLIAIEHHRGVLP